MVFTGCSMSTDHRPTQVRPHQSETQMTFISIATQAQATIVLTKPKASILQKVNSLLPDHGGIDRQVSAAVWTMTLLTVWEKRLVAIIRSQRL